MNIKFAPVSRVYLSTILFITLFSGCSSYKKITYFTNINDSSDIYLKGREVSTARFQPLIVQQDDILKIIISTLDPAADGALNLSSNPTISNPTMVSSNVTSATRTSASPDGYLVNKNGDIEVPLLGTLHVAGSTIDMVQQLVQKKASVMYKNPVVNVRLANFKVTVLGEVTKPGTYIIDGERANVLDALGLAGDMTIYGKRENLMLIRQAEGDHKIVTRLDLNNTQMMASPYFYLRQGDVLYVEPSKGKAASTDAARTRAYSVIGAVISVLIVLISRINF